MINEVFTDDKPLKHKPKEIRLTTPIAYKTNISIWATKINEIYVVVCFQTMNIFVFKNRILGQRQKKLLKQIDFAIY